MMNNTFQRIRPGLPRAFLSIATFFIAFPLGCSVFYLFNYPRTSHPVPISNAYADLPLTVLSPAPPGVQPAEPTANSAANPFQGLWHVYWPSWDSTPPELTHLPVINLIIYMAQNHFLGKAFLYNVRDDGYGEYVYKVTEAAETDIRVRKGVLYFHVHKADEDTAYKLWLVNRNEAKLCVVGDPPATVFRVKRGHQ